MKNTLRSQVIRELHEFLRDTVPIGSIVTCKEIKLWITALPETHSLIISWQNYAGSKPITQGIYALICKLPGFYRELLTHKRVGTGDSVRYVAMHRNKVKIT